MDYGGDCLLVWDGEGKLARSHSLKTVGIAKAGFECCGSGLGS